MKVITRKSDNIVLFILKNEQEVFIRSSSTFFPGYSVDDNGNPKDSVTSRDVCESTVDLYEDVTIPKSVKVQTYTYDGTDFAEIVI